MTLKGMNLTIKRQHFFQMTKVQYEIEFDVLGLLNCSVRASVTGSCNCVTGSCNLAPNWEPLCASRQPA